MASFVRRVAVRWLRRLTAGLVLTALAVVPASAGTSPLPPGTYLLEFSVLDDECDHFPFIGELPESITIEVGDDGSLIMTGSEPWVEVLATVDADGSISGAGLGAVAGFSGVSVLLEGELVEPGVLQGELTFGAGGELPGSCPIVWQLTLISETPVTTTSSTTTTSSSTTTTEALKTSATTDSPPEDTTTTTFSLLFAEDDGGSYLAAVTFFLGLLLLAGGLVWWWLLSRTPGGYGPAMVSWLRGLSSTPQPDDPTDDTTETTTETTTTTTERDDTTTTSEPDETTTEDREETDTADETTTEDRGDTDTTTDETTTDERDETTTDDGGGTRDGTTVFGPRTRTRDDCKELVDECERLREEANRLAAIAKRAAEWAARTRRRCDRAKAAAQRAQKHLDDLEPRSNVERYYERMAWAQQDLRHARTEEQQACDAVTETESDAVATKQKADEAAVRAAEACARAKDCLDNPPGSTIDSPETETPTGTPPPTDPGTSSTPRQPLPTSRCGPEAGARFVACMNRILTRLVVLFGRDAWRVTGYLFLTANGGSMDYWILSEYLDPPCHCPSSRCGQTVTLFGICYPHHVMSDFMYGFIAAWFSLSDTEINAGSAGWKAWKYAAEGFEGSFATPAWETVSQPAYAGGAAAAREALPVRRNLDVEDRHITDGLAGVAKRSECEPCPCNSVGTPDRDFSRDRWAWDEPIEIMSRWAVTGEDPPQ